MRIAVIDTDRCQPKKCSLECIKFCPMNRTGGECVLLKEELGKAWISEELCTGCGICPKKCPFTAISIVGLPEELQKDMMHQYGENAFRLFRLPYPRGNSVTGLIGQNGTGKTTIVKLLSGETMPNFGDWGDGDKEGVIQRFSGTQFHDYFKTLYSGGLKAVPKPQYVDYISRAVEGSVGELLEKVDERGALREVLVQLELETAMEKNVTEISGGELQRIAIGAALLREGDIYIFDEPSSYLDVRHRLKVAKVIRELAERKRVLVVEHDLIILDYLADYINIVYGGVGAYGIVSQPMTVRQGINVYLEGYLREENMKFRQEPVRFEVRAPTGKWEAAPLLIFEDMMKSYDGFNLRVTGGTIGRGEVIGVLGPNATGKTTFVKMLAGVIRPDSGRVDGEAKVSYKPQYIKPEGDDTVMDAISKGLKEGESPFFEAEVSKPLEIDLLHDRKLQELSGGELQRVAIALCLGRDADVYLLDEPSAYLDVEQRLKVAKMIRRVIEKKESTGIIVDHDILFTDYISDRIMVFHGTTGEEGTSTQPLAMKDGMNTFLRSANITFRRDPVTGRPRANKLHSQKDKEQKAKGEYYYIS
ncbi:MAG: ribosome biogenesis/translation initiation ATPase RLI [Candidatus Hydrothermarchaeota archaeon]|nr:ribosome biogenesis/translation initiation ATPase RLI [Candidatus Hydrothermarchaeota archaeon]